jgi:hypothetical protein
VLVQVSKDFRNYQPSTKNCHSGRFLAGIQVLEDRKTGSPIGALGDDRRFFPDLIMLNNYRF